MQFDLIDELLSVGSAPLDESPQKLKCAARLRGKQRNLFASHQARVKMDHAQVKTEFENKTTAPLEK
jgi:hypothetical protein